MGIAARRCAGGGGLMHGKNLAPPLGVNRERGEDKAEAAEGGGLGTHSRGWGQAKRAKHCENEHTWG